MRFDLLDSGWGRIWKCKWVKKENWRYCSKHIMVTNIWLNWIVKTSRALSVIFTILSSVLATGLLWSFFLCVLHPIKWKSFLPETIKDYLTIWRKIRLSYLFWLWSKYGDNNCVCFWQKKDEMRKELNFTATLFWTFTKDFWTRV